MSLRVVVAAPFKGEGRDRMGEQDFVVALSLDRDWLSPDQAKRVVEVANREGLLERDDGDLVATFPADEVTVPEDFVPDESIFQERSAFERVLDALVAAGERRQEAVAAINERQQTLGVTADVAAVLHARAAAVDVEEAATKARSALAE
ncbi:MAG: DUF2240 family protein [Halanaeroarchaeum sp.]